MSVQTAEDFCIREIRKFLAYNDQHRTMLGVIYKHSPTKDKFFKLFGPRGSEVLKTLKPHLVEDDGERLRATDLGGRIVAPWGWGY